jgi:hypothetical protein
VTIQFVQYNTGFDITGTSGGSLVLTVDFTNFGYANPTEAQIDAAIEAAGDSLASALGYTVSSRNKFVTSVDSGSF